jgi:hypothetical protein
MSATVVDLWNTAEMEKNLPKYNQSFYIDKYDEGNNVLYIKDEYHKIKKNIKSILKAFDYAIKNRKSLRLYNPTTELYELIKDKNQLIEFLEKSSGESLPRDVVFEHPSGELAYGKPEWNGGAAVYKKSTLKKHIHGRERVIYLGKHNKQYVKMNGKFVPVHK